MWIRISERIQCPRHPKFNGADIDAEAKVKGGCVYCNELIVLAILRDKVERRIAEVRDKITAVSGGRA